MCPRFTPKADLFVFINGIGWKKGIPSAIGSNRNGPTSLEVEATEIPNIPRRPVQRSAL